MKRKYNKKVASKAGKNFKEDAPPSTRKQSKLNSPQVLKVDHHIDDPGQYTESLFNFPDNGSEDPTDAKTSAVKDTGEPRKRSKGKRQAKRSLHLNLAVADSSDCSSTLLKKRGRPPNKPMSTSTMNLAEMNNLQENSTNT
jgi:hypothetical protein